MSLNWREIDAILSELDLKNWWLKRIRQPDYSRIILEFSHPGRGCAIELVLKQPYVRINRLGEKRRLPKALPKPPRFTAVLKSRIEGAKLREFGQLGRDRIVRFTFEAAGEILHLDVKLWGNAANIILSGGHGLVIDSFSRRPKSGESPGEAWPPEGIPGTLNQESTPGSGLPDDGSFPLRELPGEGDWNSRIEKAYLILETEEKARQRLIRWKSYLDRRDNTLRIREIRLEESIKGFENQCRDGHWADIIMANLHTVSKGNRSLAAEDWENPGSTIQIPLKPTLSGRENAEAYYTRQKRALRALERLEEDQLVLVNSIREIRSLLKRLNEGDTGSDPFGQEPPEDVRRKKQKKPGPGSTGSDRTLPGLWIRKDPFIIVIGRSSKESDFLLRHWARGNDMWLHVRDWPGGYVFIRAPRGKSIPLEILLDGANLALSYSKGKSALEADIYYTQVKNLRRPKEGPIGKVLPTREKNLRIRLETKRLKALKELAETG